MSQWQFWQDSLVGKTPEVKEGDIEWGYFRTRRLDPVAIWQADGIWYAKIGTKIITSEPDIADLFAQVCRAPVRHPDYMAKMVGEPWPDETALPPKQDAAPASTEQQAPAGIGHNSGSTLDQIASDLAEWDTLGKKLIAAGPIKDQATADKLSDIATKLAEFETQAEAARKAEKDPHFRAGQAVDAKWKPVIDKAEAGKKAAKAAVGEFLKAEAKRISDAAKAAAEVAGVSENVVSVASPRAGAKRAVTLRTHKFVVISDLPKAAAFFAGMADPPSEFKEMVSALALRVLTAGAPVPGAELKSEQRAA